MLSIDLKGRRALVAGVADDGGFGFAIAKSLAEAGATVIVATWPPAMNIFLRLLERKMDESRRMSDGSLLEFEKIYPLDAAFDTLADVPEEIRANKRYQDNGDFSIAGLVARLTADFGGARNRDGQGFAAFGRVVKGMDVVRRIQAAPATRQSLTPPIAITRMHRI